MEKDLIIEQFISGRYEAGAGYKYFVPTLVNRQWKWNDPTLNSLLEKASISLGHLNSFSRLVPNIDLFLHLHTTKEAVVSSRIEGTQTRIDEALQNLDDVSPERRNDWLEVQNYTNALNNSIKELKNLPLSTRLIKKAHEALMLKVRGEHKLPGEFRSSQNWIGGTSPADAIFTPPAHTYVNQLMGDLENFLHNDQIQVPMLIRAGIAHYQFETIHPFLDGNGRIGRLLITLYLVSCGLMQQPLLYLSAYFERNKELYYDNLTRVRSKSDLLHWLKYFLLGIEETANQASETLNKVIAQKSNLEKEINKKFGRRSASAFRLLTHLYTEPFVRVKDVEKVCDLSSKAAGDLIDKFVEHQILREFTNQSRNRVFSFDQYLLLFE